MIRMTEPGYEGLVKDMLDEWNAVGSIEQGEVLCGQCRQSTDLGYLALMEPDENMNGLHCVIAVCKECFAKRMTG